MRTVPRARYFNFPIIGGVTAMYRARDIFRPKFVPLLPQPLSGEDCYTVMQGGAIR